MPLLSDFPSPDVAREAFVHGSGYTEKGTPLLTLEALESFSKGRGARRERIYRCPFCGGTEAAFHVNVETGAFNCKRSSCGVKGCLREFWSDKPQFTFQGRGSVGKRTPSVFVLSPERKFVPSEGGNWRELWDASFELDATEARAGRDYLTRRGVALDVAQRAGVRFCRNWAPSVDGKPYTGGAAVLFPLTNRAGELVAVGSRYLNPWTSPEGDTIKARVGGDLIEGVFRAPVADGLDPLKGEQPVLVEGPIDALSLATCGAPAVAAGGVSFPAWLPIALAFKAPFLAPDGDEGGTKALRAWRRDIGPLAPRLRVLYVADALGLKDFGACIEKDGQEVLTEWLRGAGVLVEKVEQDEPISPTGAASICAMLQAFPFIFDVLHRGELPEGECVVTIDGQPLTFDLPVDTLRAIKHDWTTRATSCNATGRALTGNEAAALDRARQLLEELTAKYSPDGWISDLEAIADATHEKAKQRTQQHAQAKAEALAA